MLITPPSGLEEGEIEMQTSVLKKDLSAARVEIVVLRLDFNNAKSYSNALENHIELTEYLTSSLKKSAYVSSLSSEVTDPSQSNLNHKIISIFTADSQLYGNDPPISDPFSNDVNSSLQSPGRAGINYGCEVCSYFSGDASVNNVTVQVPVRSSEKLNLSAAPLSSPKNTHMDTGVNIKKASKFNTLLLF